MMSSRNFRYTLLVFLLVASGFWGIFYIIIAVIAYYESP